MAREKTPVEPNYPMSLYLDKKAGQWVAEVIDLPGCIGVGETRGAAVAVAEAFIPEWIDHAREQGWEVPQPRVRTEASGRLLVRMPKSLHALLQETAEEEGTSMNQLIVSLLSERLTLAAVRREWEELTSSLQPSTGFAVAYSDVSFNINDIWAFGPDAKPLKIDLVSPQEAFSEGKGEFHGKEC